MKRALVIPLVWMVLLATASPAAIADLWDWPDEMSLGGFSVTGIRGAVNADGSGASTGLVRIPGVVAQKVTLTRSAGGEIAGNVAMAARIAGAEIQGPFTLDAGGLKAQNAVIKLVPRSVVDAAVTVTVGGQFNGTGRVALGNVNVPVKFALSRESFNLDGSVESQAEADTPLATYKFSGDMMLEATGVRIWITARGTVKRIGKLSDQVSTTRVSDVQVNVMEGTGIVNVEGVSVTLRFFRA